MQERGRCNFTKSCAQVPSAEMTVTLLSSFREMNVMDLFITTLYSFPSSPESTKGNLTNAVKVS